MPAEERARLVRRARLLARGGNAWHVVEFAIAVGAGVAAGSIALVGFGFDSLIESFACFIILWRFGRVRQHLETAEQRAQQLVAVSYFVLAPTSASSRFGHCSAAVIPKRAGSGSDSRP